MPPPPPSSATAVARTRPLRTKPGAATASSLQPQPQLQSVEEAGSQIPRIPSPSRLPMTRFASRNASSAMAPSLTTISAAAPTTTTSTTTISTPGAANPSSSASSTATNTRSKHPPLSTIKGIFGLGRSASTRHAKTPSIAMPPPRQVSSGSGGAGVTAAAAAAAAAEPAKKSTLTLTGRTLGGGSGVGRSTTTTTTTGGGMASTATTMTTATAMGRPKSSIHLRAKSVAAVSVSESMSKRPPSAESATRSNAATNVATNTATTTTATATPRLRNPATAGAARPKSMVARVGGTLHDLDVRPVEPQQNQYQQLVQHRRYPSTAADHGPPTPAAAHAPQPPRPRPTSMAIAHAPATSAPKPAFNTFQKHYSPAKSTAPKPLTTAILAPPSPSKLPANVAASAETARLQTELLQLHLLHRDAPCVDAEWRSSAHDALSRRFAALAQRGVAMAEAEADVVEGRNAAALAERWGDAGLEEAVRALDDVLAGVWALGEPRTKESPGGRFAHVVRRFERWVAGAQDVWVRRGRGGGVVDADGEPVFVEGIDDAWKTECAGLARRLEGWRALMRDLDNGMHVSSGESSSSSSLDRILHACRRQVADMLAELDVMASIERDIVGKEDRWVRSMNRENDGLREVQPRAGAIWRVL